MPVITRTTSSSEKLLEKADEAEKSKMSAKKALTLDDIMAELQKGKKDTNQRLDVLETKFDKNQKEVFDYIEGNKAAMKKSENTVKNMDNRLKQAEDTIQGLETRITALSNELEMAIKNSLAQQKLLDALEKKDKLQESEKKKYNILIEGLAETEKENTRLTVKKMLEDIGVNNINQNVVTAFRLGAVKSSKRSRPRMILVKLSSPNFKHEIYKNVKKLKDNDSYKRTYVKDDLPEDIARQRQELRCLAVAARDRGYETTIRGGALVVDNKRYTYSDIDDLPEGITLENAKIVQVDDGLAFQSHHAYLSNMFKCTIVHEGNTFTSSEQNYWHDIATLAGDQRAIEELRDVKNGYEAKRIGERIKIIEDIKQQKEPIMARAIERKFRQNPVLVRKLIATQGNLYEATTDTLFGCGLVLAQKAQIGKPGMPGHNKLGNQLMDLRGTLWVENGITP